MTFGKRATLWEHSPFLRKKNERAARIVDAAERNSIIEGLPPFGKHRRQRMIKELERNA
ncbi:hypothetical protein HY213_01485 [Candidatus Peregrinibacteria bacterium]|nr:hypothetical protein [Candidatus Peregrinibacteria bacterium]